MKRITWIVLSLVVATVLLGLLNARRARGTADEPARPAATADDAVGRFIHGTMHQDMQECAGVLAGPLGGMMKEFSTRGEAIDAVHAKLVAAMEQKFGKA